MQLGAALPTAIMLFHGNNGLAQAAAELDGASRVVEHSVAVMVTMKHPMKPEKGRRRPGAVQPSVAAFRLLDPRAARGRVATKAATNIKLISTTMVGAGALSR